VRFYPQAWQNDYAIDVDPEGPTEFEVEASTLAEVLSQYDEWSKAYSHEPFAKLRETPEWMLEWRGPFYYEVVWPEEKE